MKPTAVVGRRVGAYLLDTLLLIALNAAMFFPLAQTEEELAAGLSAGEIDPNASAYVNLTLGEDTYSIVGGDAGLYFLLVLLLWFGYWCVLQGRTGWTLGKRLLGIRLVKDDGSLPPGVLRSFARQFMWIADGFPYLIPNLTGFIVAKTNSRNKRIGDMVANTLVVRKEFAGQSAAAAPAEPAAFEAPGPAPPDASAAEAPPAAVEAAASPAPAPGWYPDPQGEKRLRYWDGSAWTDQTAD